MDLITNSINNYRHTKLSRKGSFLSFRNIFILFLLGFAGISETVAQTTTTFPPPSKCTSKDLELVSATLTGGDLCNSCTPGATLSRTLTLGINNKTGSTRTAFSFWGTLEITRPNGTVVTTGIGRCSGPIPSTGPLPASYTGGNFGTVTYQCGDALRLINLFLAWTDAAPGSTCASINSATINPKCGTLPAININAGVNGLLSFTNPTCTALGAVSVSPFGGTAPYTVLWTGSNGGVVPAGQSTGLSLTGLVAGSYSCAIKDANNCVFPVSRDITLTGTLPAPSNQVTQPTCAVATGTVTVQSPANGVTYQLKQGGILKYTANNNGVFASVVLGTYSFIATNGTCSTAGPDTTVDPQPVTPAVPTTSVTQPTCTVATATITVQTLENGVTYQLKQGGILKYTANGSGVFNSVVPATYALVAILGACSSNGTDVTVNLQPITPDVPTASVTQPTCTTATATVTVQTPANGVIYQLKQGGVLKYTASNSGVFSLVVTGTYAFIATNGTCSSNGQDVVVNPQPSTPAEPNASVTQPTCAIATGTVNIQSSDNGITYQLKQAGVLKYTANASGVFSSVVTGTYALIATTGICTATGSDVTVNTQPVTPGAPTTSVTPPTCAVATATVTVQSPASGVTYQLKQGGVLKYTASNSGLFSLVIPGTYALIATNGVCTSTGPDVTVNLQPQTPPAPTICVVQPSLCGPVTGSVTILTPVGTGYEYSIDNGATWQSGAVFSNLAPGSVTGIKAKKDGCASTASNCDDSNCLANRVASKPVVAPTELQPTNPTVNFDAFPVPFKNLLTIKYKFDYKTDVKIEIFNAQGNSIFSKKDTNGFYDKEVTLDLNVKIDKQQIYIVKLTTSKGSSIKKIISN